jgi:hypothetical protein
VLDLSALPTNQEFTEIFLYVQTCYTVQKVMTLCSLPDFAAVTHTHTQIIVMFSLLHRCEDQMHHFFLANRHSLPEAEQYMNA